MFPFQWLSVALHRGNAVYSHLYQDLRCIRVLCLQYFSLQALVLAGAKFEKKIKINK